ncbi:MAG: hypothetical protein ACP5OZ_01275 [Candidatus Woesearchaeota archaeon]
MSKNAKILTNAMVAKCKSQNSKTKNCDAWIDLKINKEYNLEPTNQNSW